MTAAVVGIAAILLSGALSDAGGADDATPSPLVVQTLEPTPTPSPAPSPTQSHGVAYTVVEGDTLSGKHDFYRFNPMAGATYDLTPGLTLYGSYAEANRAPGA